MRVEQGDLSLERNVGPLVPRRSNWATCVRGLGGGEWPG